MLMKLKIALLIIVPLFFTGCEGWLELVPPDGLVRDEYWQSKEDVEASLMGAYQLFASSDFSKSSVFFRNASASLAAIQLQCRSFDQTRQEIS